LKKSESKIGNLSGSRILADIQSELENLGDPEQAAFLRRFFKTGPGEYGEGDIFRGIRVPPLRKLAVRYGGACFPAIKALLGSPFHEDRLLALLILVRRFSQGDDAVRKRIYRLYLDNTGRINNWDLVDASAEHIVGAFLLDRSREPLYRLAVSSSLWERRIAVTATFHFIRRGDFADTLRIAEMLLLDREDLIHKATGWMLREVGKRDPEREKSFLKTHCRRMPRVMLRYAIEKFPEPERRRYLTGQAV